MLEAIGLAPVLGLKIGPPSINSVPHRSNLVPPTASKGAGFDIQGGTTTLNSRRLVQKFPPKYNAIIFQFSFSLIKVARSASFPSIRNQVTLALSFWVRRFLLFYAFVILTKSVMVRFLYGKEDKMGNYWSCLGSRYIVGKGYGLL